MQHELKTSRRASSPVFCPFCGASVTTTSPTCAICGANNPAAKSNDTLDFGTASVGAGLEEVLHHFEREPMKAVPPPQSGAECLRCDARLELGAKFCWRCGGTVPVPTSPRVDPPRREPSKKNIVPMPRPAHSPSHVVEPVKAERPRGRHIVLADLDGVGDAAPASGSHAPMDYLDAQLGLKAPGREEKAVEVSAAPAARPPREEPAPLESDTGGGVAWVAYVPAVFGVFALGVALLVHLFAPNVLAGYSPPELDLKVQLRAIEWLLAGLLVALVGLYFRR